MKNYDIKLLFKMVSFFTKFLLVLFTCLVITAWLSGCASLIERKEYPLANPNVKMIKADQSFGAGFYYRGYFLTAAHVPTNEQLYADKFLDIKIVRKVKEKGLKQADRYPKFGEVVSVFFPELWKINDGDMIGTIIGRIPGLWVGKSPYDPKYHGNAEYFIRVNTLNGSSGSPVLNLNNEFLGLLTSYLPTSSGFFGPSYSSTVVYIIGKETVNRIIDEYEEKIKDK